MASVLEKRVLPQEVAPGGEAGQERPELAWEGGLDRVPAAETALPEAVEEVSARLQLEEGAEAASTDAQEVHATPATVLLFPNAADRAAYQAKSAPNQIVHLLHTRSTSQHPGAVVEVLRDLSQAA